MITYARLTRDHLDDVAAVCRVLDWPSYTVDAELTWKALTAPGSTTLVAVEATRVIGFVQILSEGVVQAHLSLVGVLPSHRRRGIASRLIREAFRLCGAKWLDLVSSGGCDEFYRSFEHKEFPGFRIYPSE